MHVWGGKQQKLEEAAEGVSILVTVVSTLSSIVNQI